jgi:gamma-glutamylcyclotransferase (GGCT)/AIG2-like uncharacterized protein YtfP
VNTIFVYGLLKPGQRLHYVAEPFVTRSEQATARGRLYDAGSSEASPSDGLPAARFDEDGDIDGNVFWLDEARLDEALRVLDELEDEGAEYRRITVDVRIADKTVSAFAYEYLLPLDGRPFVGRSWR